MCGAVHFIVVGHSRSPTLALANAWCAFCNVIASVHRPIIMSGASAEEAVARLEAEASRAMSAVLEQLEAVHIAAAEGNVRDSALHADAASARLIETQRAITLLAFALEVRLGGDPQ